MNKIIEDMAKASAEDLAQHIEEFACAYFKKTKTDPRKVVMIHQSNIFTGKSIYWFEKKRGRSRKQILENLIF